MLCLAGRWVLLELSLSRTPQQGQHSSLGPACWDDALQGACFADTTVQAWLSGKPSITSTASFKMLNLYIKTRTNNSPPSKQGLKEESCLWTGETSFKWSIYILDTYSIRIAGWASVNLVWKQPSSAVCLPTYLLLHLFFATSPRISTTAYAAAKTLKKPPYLAHPPASLFCSFPIFNKQLSLLSFYCLVIYSAAITK